MTSQVHIIPILTVVVIAALNLQGYYIGPTYQGGVSDSYQNLDVRGLQIAAKVLVYLSRSYTRGCSLTHAGSIHRNSTWLHDYGHLSVLSDSW